MAAFIGGECLSKHLKRGGMEQTDIKGLFWCNWKRKE